MTSRTPYYGRAYSIKVTTAGGEEITLASSSFNQEPLKVHFQTELVAIQSYSFCDLVIYNLNAQTEQYLVSQGDTVSISAGYQSNFAADTNLIWSGQVFQPLFERENVVDLKLTLRCLQGWLYDVQNFASFSLAAGSTHLDVVNGIVSNASNPIPVEQLDTATLSQKTYPRGVTVHGRPGDYLSRIAKDNKLSYWISPNGLNVRSLTPAATNPDFIFGPPLPAGVKISTQWTPSLGYTPTLIGTPQQTQQGVSFRVLLDSRLKIGSLVKLDMSLIRQLPQYPGSYPSFLDQDGLYVAAGIRHIGDTRGNDWFTEITGITRSFWQTYNAVQ